MTKAQPGKMQSEPSRSTEDFSMIKGVGHSTAQTFLKLGFTKFEDLTEYSCEGLAELLRSRGLTISPQRIERDDWIGQAKALANQEPVNPQEKPEFETPWQGDASWHEMADFFVSFGYLVTQEGEKRLITRAAHSQSGDGHHDWEGVGKEQLDQCLQWMQEQAGLSASPWKSDSLNENAHATAGIAGAPSNAELLLKEICETRVQQGTGGMKLESAIRVVASYDLPDSALTLTAENHSVCAEIYLIHLQTNQPRLMATSLKRLQGGVLSYPIVLDFPKPEPGRYQLFLTSSLIESTAAAARLKGPVIRIE
jgi:hypothetical protein